MNLYCCKTMETVIYVLAPDITTALKEGIAQAQKLRAQQPAIQREIFSVAKFAENVVIPTEARTT